MVVFLKHSVIVWQLVDRTDYLDLQISILQTILSASGVCTNLWLSFTISYTRLGRGIRVLYTTVTAGALFLPLKKLVAQGEGGASPIFQRSQDSNPGPCLLSPNSSHLTSVQASPLHLREPPQRASRKTHNGIFEQLPKDGFQIFSYFSLVMEALSG